MSDTQSLYDLVRTIVRAILLLVAAIRWLRDRHAKMKRKPRHPRRRRSGQAKPPRARSKGGRRRRSRRFA